MFDKILHHPFARILTGVAGALLMALGTNLFIVPLGLYSGGVLGLCQLLRTLLVDFLHIDLPFDVSGVLYLLINLPLFALAWRNLGHSFVARTIITTVANSLFLTLIPVTPVVDDILTSCLLGGILVGFSCGLILTCGCSTGGLDIIGLYLSKRGKGFTVGRFSLGFNAGLYTVCLFLFNASIAIYSAIYNVFAAMFLDRVHQQNIAVQMLIFTKDKRQEISQYILEHLSRGVTYWQGHGGYTGEDVHVLCVCLSKYEVDSLQRSVRGMDPGAFFIVQEGVRIGGNFVRDFS